MKVVVILDVTAAAGEPRRKTEDVHEAVEQHLDGASLEVYGVVDPSVHSVSVKGIGATVKAATESERLRRRQEARHDPQL